MAAIGMLFSHKRATLGRRVIGVGLLLSGLFYLADCVIAHRAHPEIPWLMSGIHAVNPFGFPVTIIAFVVLLGSGVFQILMSFFKPHD